MRTAQVLLVATSLMASAVGAQAQPQPQPYPQGQQPPPQACTPGKNGKSVLCPMGGPYPPASICAPHGRRGMMCRQAKPGTILTPPQR